MNLLEGGPKLWSGTLVRAVSKMEELLNTILLGASLLGTGDTLDTLIEVVLVWGTLL